ncbi:hypothetical protein A0128_14765 [Leptospira tipperaryensis]|uniref:Uncharacterized protein n=1 Tax=Leptospira tipperaryensis TaxID=2564040 RepID=A0A1D7UZJ3_9LEPT|nr:hypothetical protein [Leptospira tipperaryensis]AOP34999.1 hypothetical protein A0128_14765 [Leptospira tipperaryensis]
MSFNFFKNRFTTSKIALPPLQFSEIAISAIRKHLEKRPQSAFQVRIERKKHRVDVQVGYDQKKNLKTLYSYPVLLEISKEDEICLEGSRLDWDEESSDFRIYPDVDLEIEYGMVRKRFQILVNRFVFQDENRKEIYNEGNFPDWFSEEWNTFGISKIEIQGRIWNVVLETRPDPKQILEIEKKIADWILDYFSGFPKRRD